MVAFSRPDVSTDPYEAALAKVVKDLDANAGELRIARQRVVVLERENDEIIALGQSLITRVAPHVRAEYEENYPCLGPTPDTASRSAVLTAVVQLLKEGGDKIWSAGEVHAALKRQEINSDAKRVYNILNYLAADKRIQRLGRGQYTMVRR